MIPVIFENDKTTTQYKINYIGPYIKTRKILIMLHTNVSDCKDWLDYYRHILQWYDACGSNNVPIIVHQNLKAHDNIHISYDYLWNRQKAYFIDYDRYPIQRGLWTENTTKRMFSLSDIVPCYKTEFSKIFLMPVRLRTFDKNQDPRSYYRQLLVNNFAHDVDTWYSKWWRHNDEPGIKTEFKILEGEEEYDIGVNDLEKWIIEFRGWRPIANRYYSNTIISTYVETISTHGEVSCVTEKTYDPLIKGIFILPFGYSGLIRDLKVIYGFKFPDWIDYSYDIINDDDRRFNKFTNEISRLRSLGIDHLIKLRNRDIDLLKHNREIFFNRPYDSLYDKLIRVKNRLLQ